MQNKQMCTHLWSHNRGYTLTQFRKCRISIGVSHTLNWVWSALFIHYYVLSRQDMPGDGLEQPMAILISETDTRVLIEGTEVLSNVPSTAAAVAMLFGLTYVLNLKYPKELKFTFEFFQKVLMELDSRKMTPKICRLCTLLHSQWLTDSLHFSALMNTMFNIVIVVQ